MEEHSDMGAHIGKSKATFIILNKTSRATSIDICFVTFCVFAYLRDDP